MRDVTLVLIFGVLAIYGLKRPWIAALIWVWVSLMNPHRLTWGFAFSLPFAQMSALILFVSLFINTDKQRKLPLVPITVLLVIFCIWMTITTTTAIHPSRAWVQWDKVMKIQLMGLLCLYVLYSKQHILWFTRVTTLSLGFYGVKGGVNTILSGGGGRVWGPPGSFIYENNSLALAIVMVIPLMYAFYRQASRPLLRMAILASMVLSAFAVLGSQSRGALLAGAGMVAFLWLKSHSKLPMLFGLIGAIPLILGFMPNSWWDRMETIGAYKEDDSAMGRINAWLMVLNMVDDKPLFGGGFEFYGSGTFAIWAPDPTDVHSTHSIYFQVLGDHGYPGLAIFLAILVLSWRSASKVIGMVKEHSELSWVGDINRMIQVGMAGYMVGGIFLNLAYFDLPYFMVGIVVLSEIYVRRELKKKGGIEGYSSRLATPDRQLKRLESV